jgi:IrrE N-terminal-like domain
LQHRGIEFTFSAFGERTGHSVDSSSDEVGENLARELYVSAGVDRALATGAPSVAATVLGESCLHVVPHEELPSNALLQRGGRGWVIYVRRGLSASQLNHAIARELAQWFLRRRGCAEAELEELAGRVAAAICVPTTALLSAHEQLGEDLIALSRQFAVSESLMALRVAECLGTPTALITRKVVRTRGRACDWPVNRDSWELLVSEALRDSSVLAARRLSDSEGRIVLRLR